MPLYLLRTSLFIALLGLTSSSWAASKTEIDAQVRAAITELYKRQPAAQELANKAAGVLVFPQAIKVGLGFGGKVGEGALLVNGLPVQYYRLTAGSFGFQLGAQARSEVLMFMTEGALQNFRNSQGWEAGVDGSVALIEFGVGDSVNTNSARDPIIGFVYGNKGLMYDLSLEGTKYWRISKEPETATDTTPAADTRATADNGATHPDTATDTGTPIAPGRPADL